MPSFAILREVPIDIAERLCIKKPFCCFHGIRGRCEGDAHREWPGHPCKCSGPPDYESV